MQSGSSSKPSRTTSTSLRTTTSSVAYFIYYQQLNKINYRDRSGYEVLKRRPEQAQRAEARGSEERAQVEGNHLLDFCLPRQGDQVQRVECWTRFGQ